MIKFACDSESETGHAEAFKDVIHKNTIKVGRSTKAPDCCFRIDLLESSALFGMSAGVDYADRPGASMSVHHHAMEMIVRRLVVPVQKGEKLLQRPHRRTGGQRDRLDALPLQIGRQTQHVRQQVPEIRGPPQIRTEHLQQRNQRRPQGSNLIRSHYRVS